MSTKEKNISGHRINCFGCANFYITYEPRHPYGCRAMSFKSAELPSLAVYKSSGMDCQMYQGKG